MLLVNIRDAARRLLEEHTRTVTWRGKRYTFTVPSPDTYPFQWFWDSCFHAIVWTHFDPERARRELQSLLAWQRPGGFIPHLIFWDRWEKKSAPWYVGWMESGGRSRFFPTRARPETSELMQPPILAHAVYRLWEATGDVALIRDLVPACNRYYEWLHNVRLSRDRLLSLVAPYESGLDSTPAYDDVLGYRSGRPAWEYWLRYRSVVAHNALRFDHRQHEVVRWGPFHVKDALVNSVYLQNLAFLAKLNDLVPERWEWEKEYFAQAMKVRDALIKKCWDPKRQAFFNLNGRQGSRSNVLTVASLMPLIFHWLPRQYVEPLVEHLLNPDEFWLPYPVPSVAATEPAFSAKSRLIGSDVYRHWRGGTWMNTNWYLVYALRRHGYDAEADELADRCRSLVFRSGFRECFNPQTGAGLGAEQLAWTTLVVDL